MRSVRFAGDFQDAIEVGLFRCMLSGSCGGGGLRVCEFGAGCMEFASVAEEEQDEQAKKGKKDYNAEGDAGFCS